MTTNAVDDASLKDDTVKSQHTSKKKRPLKGGGNNLDVEAVWLLSVSWLIGLFALMLMAYQIGSLTSGRVLSNAAVGAAGLIFDMRH